MNGAPVRGVAFDLDGTLYPNYRLYLRLLPSFFAHPRFFAAFGAARSALHKAASEPDAGGGDFFTAQAELMAHYLRSDPETVRLGTERIIYRGWERHFENIALFPGVRETLAAFREAGLKLAVLSDFPPERKLALLGLSDLFDAAVSSEACGRLKPHRLPFESLAAVMGLSPGEILYVGNSLAYDVRGAAAAGFHTALIRRGALSTGSGGASPRGADGGLKAEFVFKDYRQLREYVIG